METSAAGPRRILLATDLEPKSDRAMERAMQLARQFAASLAVLCVIRGTGGPYDHLPAHLVEGELRRHLRTIVGAAEVAPQVAAVRGDDVAAEVADFAGKWQPDLVVAGVHDRDTLADLFLPPTAEQIGLLQGAPLLVVRRKPLGPYLAALVPVDFSDLSQPSVLAARRIIADGSMTLLHVHDLPGPVITAPVTVMVDDFADSFREVLSGTDLAGLLVSTEVRTGAPVGQIVSAAGEGGYDLVVMGTARRSSLSRTLFGSTTREALGLLQCDVLLVGPR